jgi:hypothetical protein
MKNKAKSDDETSFSGTQEAPKIRAEIQGAKMHDLLNKIKAGK